MPTSHPKQDSFDEEIDLRELVNALGQSKWLILSITLTFTAAAAVYAMVSTPVYKAQAITTEPTLTKLAGYNSANSVLELPPAISSSARSEVAIISSGLGTPPAVAVALRDLTPPNAYSTFLSTLQSAELRQAFFEKVYLPANNDSSASKPHISQLRATLDRSLIIQPSGSNSTGPTTIMWEGTNPQQIAGWLNQYIDMALRVSHDRLVSVLVAAGVILTH